MEEKIDEILSLVRKLSASAPTSAKSTAGEIADDADLDSKYGNEDIRRDPSAKYWSGDSSVGKKMSECDANYLDAYAKYKDACAYANEKEGNAEKAKYIGYDRKSARRARGWAKRVRDGHPSAKANSDDLFSESPSSDDIPF